MYSGRQMWINEEKDQTFFRMGISVFTFCAILGTHLMSGSTLTPAIIQGLSVILFHATFSICWFFYIKKCPAGWPPRIYVAMFMDVTTTSLAFYFAARFGSFFYPVFLWVIVGYGLRFGKRALFFASMMAFIEYGLVLQFNEYWLQNRMTGVGLWWGLLILPAIFMTVLQRVSALNKKLQIELVRSKAAEKAKGEFLANMSHEIRTPLNGVLGMATILEDAQIDSEGAKHLAILKRSAESLLDIVNDILDFSKITSGNVAMEKVSFNLNSVLTEVAQILQPAVVTKGLELSLDFPSDLNRNFEGDPVRIRQIILNLAGNAVKFTNSGYVKLGVQISDLQNGTNQIYVKIQDSGVGIPEDRLPYIFDQFEQAETSTTRNFGGTGLGLAISRHLARNMAGDVLVESSVGAGSTFIVSMILATGDAVPEKAPAKTTLPQLDLRVLVAEDNRVNQLVIRKLLKKVGIVPVMAINGQEALDILDDQDFDLIFMDVRMPVMDGLEATRQIRARSDEKSGIPVVALTADADNESAKRCLEAGMNRHLGKPVRLSEAVAALEEFAPTINPAS